MFIGRKTFTALTLATSVLGASAFADGTQQDCSGRPVDKDSDKDDKSWWERIFG